MKTKFDIFFDEQSHTYLVDGEEVPSVTEILKPLSGRGYEKVNPMVLELAAERGTLVHEACEAIDNGEEPDLLPEIEGFVSAYVDWKTICRPSWVGIEKIVYNDAGKYIGTADRIGYIDDKLAVVDLKTSQPTKEALVSVCIQTLAYAMAYSMEWQDAARYGLFLKADGSYRLVDCKEYEKKYNMDSLQAWWTLVDVNAMVRRLLKTKGKR